MEEKFSYDSIDLNDNRTIVYFGQTTIEYFYKLTEELAKTKDYMDKLSELSKKIDTLLLKVESAKKEISYDIDYYDKQSQCLDNKALRLKY